MASKTEKLRFLAEVMGWSGMYGVLGLGPSLPPPAWPFRTQTADVVYRRALELLPEMIEGGNMEIIRRAIESTNTNGNDLTAEDWQLLEMSLAWARTQASAEVISVVGS